MEFFAQRFIVRRRTTPPLGGESKKAPDSTATAKPPLSDSQKSITQNLRTSPQLLREDPNSPNFTLRTEPVEIESFVTAAGRADNIGETVGFQRFAGPVPVHRPVVVGLAHDEVVGARIVRRIVVFGRFRRRRIRAVAIVGSATFQQRIARHFLGDVGVQLEVAELQQLDRLGQLGRQHQRLALPDRKAWPQAHRRRCRYSAKLSPR